MLKHILIVTSLIATSVVALTVKAAEQTFSSGDQQVALIELYTSEGCSSCPPADRWMSTLKADDGLWDTFVPLAFHVDYWDYIGWKDPFASRANSQRQRRYAKENRERTVYTPGLRRSGEEWRAWSYGDSVAHEQPKTIGKLSVKVQDGQRFSANFVDDQGQPIKGQLNVALLGLELSTDVTRGENSGRKLDHDFVVLGLSTHSSAKSGEWAGRLPEASNAAPKYALAAWVTQNGRLTPVQATGGMLLTP